MQESLSSLESIADDISELYRQEPKYRMLASRVLDLVGLKAPEEIAVQMQRIRDLRLDSVRRVSDVQIQQLLSKREQVGRWLEDHGLPNTSRPVRIIHGEERRHGNIDLHYKESGGNVGRWSFYSSNENKLPDPDGYYAKSYYRTVGSQIDNPDAFRFVLVNGYVPEESIAKQLIEWGPVFRKFSLVAVQYLEENPYSERGKHYIQLRGLDFSLFLNNTYQFHLVFYDMEKRSGRPIFGTPYEPSEGRPLQEMSQLEFQVIQRMLDAYVDNFIAAPGQPSL